MFVWVPLINVKIEPDTQRLLGRKEIHLKTPGAGGWGGEWVSDVLLSKVKSHNEFKKART